MDKYFPGVPTKMSNLPTVCGRFGDSSSGNVCTQSKLRETMDGAPLEVLSSVEMSNRALAMLWGGAVSSCTMPKRCSARCDTQ